jgi:hypothetical protein
MTRDCKDNAAVTITGPVAAVRIGATTLPAAPAAVCSESSDGWVEPKIHEQALPP